MRLRTSSVSCGRADAPGLLLRLWQGSIRHHAGEPSVSGKRRSYESGHRPKFMVVVDKTPECARAVHFASRRTARTGASLVMLAVVDPPDDFEWLGVGEAMVEEAREEAEKWLEAAGREARSAAGVEPEQVIRVGDRAG